MKLDNVFDKKISKEALEFNKLTTGFSKEFADAFRKQLQVFIHNIINGEIKSTKDKGKYFFFPLVQIHKKYWDAAYKLGPSHSEFSQYDSYMAEFAKPNIDRLRDQQSELTGRIVRLQANLKYYFGEDGNKRRLENELRDAQAELEYIEGQIEKAGGVAKQVKQVEEKVKETEKQQQKRIVKENTQKRINELEPSKSKLNKLESNQRKLRKILSKIDDPTEKEKLEKIIQQTQQQIDETKKSLATGERRKLLENLKKRQAKDPRNRILSKQIQLTEGQAELDNIQLEDELGYGEKYFNNFVDYRREILIKSYLNQNGLLDKNDPLYDDKVKAATEDTNAINQAMSQYFKELKSTKGKTKAEQNLKDNIKRSLMSKKDQDRERRIVKLRDKYFPTDRLLDFNEDQIRNAIRQSKIRAFTIEPEGRADADSEGGDDATGISALFRHIRQNNPELDLTEKDALYNYITSFDENTASNIGFYTDDQFARGVQNLFDKHLNKQYNEQTIKLSDRDRDLLGISNNEIKGYKLKSLIQDKFGFEGDAVEEQAVKMAETELAAAYNIGLLQEYLNRGIKYLAWVVDPLMLKRDKSCKRCIARLYGGLPNLSFEDNKGYYNVYPISEAISNPELMLPVHPYCGCTWRPIPPEDNENYRDKSGFFDILNKSDLSSKAWIAGAGTIISALSLYAAFRLSRGNDLLRVKRIANVLPLMKKGVVSLAPAAVDIAQEIPVEGSTPISLERKPPRLDIGEFADLVPEPPEYYFQELLRNRRELDETLESDDLTNLSGNPLVLKTRKTIAGELQPYTDELGIIKALSADMDKAVLGETLSQISYKNINDPKLEQLTRLNLEDYFINLRDLPYEEQLGKLPDLEEYINETAALLNRTNDNLTALVSKQGDFASKAKEIDNIGGTLWEFNSVVSGFQSQVSALRKNLANARRTYNIIASSPAEAIQKYVTDDISKLVNSRTWLLTDRTGENLIKSITTDADSIIKRIDRELSTFGEQIRYDDYTRIREIIDNLSGQTRVDKNIEEIRSNINKVLSYQPIDGDGIRLDRLESARKRATEVGNLYDTLFLQRSQLSYLSDRLEELRAKTPTLKLKLATQKNVDGVDRFTFKPSRKAALDLTQKTFPAYSKNEYLQGLGQINYDLEMLKANPATRLTDNQKRLVLDAVNRYNTVRIFDFNKLRNLDPDELTALLDNTQQQLAAKAETIRLAEFIRYLNLNTF
jgi:hypothetical protein